MSQSAPPVADPVAPAPPPPAPAGRRIRLWLAVLIVIAAVVAGVALVGAAVRLDADELPTGPPLPAPSPTPVGLETTDSTRETAYRNVKVTLAGSPYYCADEPQAMGPFAEAVPCSYTVHGRYDGKSSWQAETGLALVPDTLAVEGDPQATAKAVLDNFVRTAYPKDETLSKLEVGPFQTATAAGVASARINFDVPELATRYDAAVVVVLTADDGRLVTFYSLKPDDAGDAALKAVQASAETLTTS